jgi:hypothetical protein
MVEKINRNFCMKIIKIPGTMEDCVKFTQELYDYHNKNPE